MSAGSKIEAGRLAEIRARPPVEIPLTKGKVAVVDYIDLPEIVPYVWFAYKNGQM